MQITDNYLQVKHLYHRAGFGLSIQDWNQVMGKNVKKLARELVRTSQKSALEPPLSLTALPVGVGRRQLSEEERKELQKMIRQGVKTLNSAWISHMATSKAVLREKMTFFWHDHFACRVNSGLMIQQQYRAMKEHALGNFKDLLVAVSQSPAMLQFLNNQQNRKGHPNENFARELLELFTLGRGHYSEQDIKEAARAFTGWGFNRRDGFVFRQRIHDTGMKEFLGQKGRFGGEDIIRIILEKRQTAYFITEKLYRFLVNEQVDSQQVQTWGNHFYDSGYEIADLLERMLTSDHFYQQVHIGSRIKSPVEFLVSMMRQLNVAFEEEDAPIIVQRLLGQVLFQPPNVAGWPSGRAWIDSSSLMARLQIPKGLIWGNEFGLASKASFAGNEDAVQLSRRQSRKLAAHLDWKPLEKELLASSSEKTLAQAWNFLQQRPLKAGQLALIGKTIGNKPQDQALKLAFMRIMETPEYQFC